MYLLLISIFGLIGLSIGFRVSALATACLWAYLYFIYIPTESTITSTYTPIYSIGSPHSDVSGSFYMGYGTIESTPMYSFFVKRNGALYKEFIPSKGTAIIESDAVEPRVVKYTCVPGLPELKWGWDLHVAESAQCSDGLEYYKLYVPANSVIQSFNIN